MSDNIPVTSIDGDLKSKYKALESKLEILLKDETPIRTLVKEAKASGNKDEEKAALEKLKIVMKSKKEITDNMKKLKEANGGEFEQEDKYVLKCPKGTKDYDEKDMSIRGHLFDTIRSVFERHGSVTIDTPVFELREILMGKYGEDSKLIYDLEEQGGELCSLRYDLTVPFARYLAQNGIDRMKRYHIAKVYRRDNPAINRGRMREFYQCDFDVAGVYDSMIPDAEVLCVLSETLNALKIEDFSIKLNHRKILDGMFAVCGVPEDKIRAISSAVDKLDKLPWDEVRKEMVEVKGLDPIAADKIEEYVKYSGKGEDAIELCKKLIEHPELQKNNDAIAGIKDLQLLFSYLQIFGVLENVHFDLSLARGLDYYTGVIYEAVVSSSRLVNKQGEQIGVGSIAAGGRYDNLVGMFSGGKQIPCVGVSFGVERIFAILSARQNRSSVRSTKTQVYVVAIGEGFLEERLKIVKELWSNGISAEFMFKKKPRNLPAQFDVCDKEMIPLSVIIGKSEVESGIVKVRKMGMQYKNDPNQEETIPRTELIAHLKKIIPTIDC